MLIVALRLILKDNGGKQHCLPFLGSNLKIQIFLKKTEHHKKDAFKYRNEVPLYTLC